MGMRIGAFAIDFDPDFFLEMGFESLVFPFDTPKDVLRQAEKDFEVFIEFKPFETNGKYYVENVLGSKADLKVLGCPSNEELRKENIFKLRDVEYEVIMDFVRFPSPSNGEFFYSCFCEHCQRKAREMGYNLEEIRKNVREYLKTDKIGLLEDWFRFKQEVIEDYIEWVKLDRAFFFTPSLSFLVGQSYDFMLKCIHPMVYPEAVGPACIEYELSYMKGALKEAILKELGGKGDKLIEKEVKKAISISKAKIEPIIMVSKNLAERIKLAERGGVEGVFIFAYSRDKRELFK